MPVKLLMGNEAIGLGALHAGVDFVSGYPGTPSTEVLETVAKNNDGSVYVEWSTNEKAALEAAAGAAYSGARALVTMKQVGLNVASDPLMTLAYLGVEGGLVIVVADDPGPISSQTEQDTRNFAQFAKVPVFDPSSPGEAYGMIQDAFECSEKYHTPVIFRPTTRVCHACGSVKTRGGVADCGAEFKNAELADNDNSWNAGRKKPAGFVKDTSRWVVFPRTSYLNHDKIEKRAPEIARFYSAGYRPNRIEMSGGGAVDGHHKFGIACGGVSYQYVLEACKMLGLDLPVLKIATPYPFPEPLALEFLGSVDRILSVEELDPVIERELIFICGKQGIEANVHGKLDASFGFAGEQSPEAIAHVLCTLLELPNTLPAPVREGAPEVPARPPVLCAGCPHRASFYAVKRACKGRKAVFCGDIGCYTLGNAAPLEMVDTCLCMGADITVAQGIGRIDEGSTVFSFIGDSTFFASGITGVVNAVYNGHDQIICVLDNSTTAMTGQQPHPGIGLTMMGEQRTPVSIPAVLEAIGVDMCETVDALDLNATMNCVKRALEMERGVRVIIFKSPCISVSKPRFEQVTIEEDACIDCRKCINEIGCPGLVIRNGQVSVDTTLCYGCNLCAKLCPTGAIVEGAAR